MRQHTGHFGEGGKASVTSHVGGQLLGLRISALGAHWNHLDKKIQMLNVLYVDRGGGYLDAFLCKNLSKHTFDICVLYCLKSCHKIYKC